MYPFELCELSGNLLETRPPLYHREIAFPPFAGFKKFQNYLHDMRFGTQIALQGIVIPNQRLTLILGPR
jgi:hypothetical protein